MDFFQLLRVHLEHQSLVRLWRFAFFGVCSPLDLFLFLLLIALVFFFLIAGVSHGRCYGRALYS